MQSSQIRPRTRQLNPAESAVTGNARAGCPAELAENMNARISLHIFCSLISTFSHQIGMMSVKSDDIVPCHRAMTLWRKTLSRYKSDGKLISGKTESELEEWLLLGFEKRHGCEQRFRPR